MVSWQELSLYGILNYLPYTFMALLPFKKSFRFSERTTWIGLGLSCILQCISFQISFRSPSEMAEISSIIGTFLDLAFFFLAVKARPGRIVFNLFLVTNIANSVVITSKCIEGFLFPDLARNYYCWSLSLCTIVVQLLTLIPFYRYLKRFSIFELYNNDDSIFWRYVWAVPAFFYFVWYYTFYHQHSNSSLEVSLEPSTAIFNVILLMGQLIIYAGVSIMIYSFEKNLKTEEEKHQLSLMTLQYANLKDHINEARSLRHDMRHHMNTIQGYLQNKNYSELETYVSTYCQKLSELPRLSFCTNQTFNMILVYYYTTCQQNQIDFQVQLALPEKLPLDDIETSVLFGNLLENAVTACKNQTFGKRAIHISGRIQQNQLILAIDNTFSGTVTQKNDGKFLSTKHDGDGIGTSSSREIIRSHNGFISFDVKENLFCVSIMLPC